MAEKNSLLILRLEGALQSWGENAKWDFRDSASMPTKSGVVGLIACAMGLEREDPEIAALSRAIRIAVRADRPGTRIVDFQTITGNPLRNAEGKPRSLGNTFISERAYLQDASFLVVIETDEVWHGRIVTALQNPRRPIYLGRKCCVPSRPVLECDCPDYRDLLDAVRRYPRAERAGDAVMTYESEKALPDSVTYTRPDETAEGYRSFAQRRVWRGVIKEAEYVSDKN